MTIFDATFHPRGHASHPGRFSDKENSAPEYALGSAKVHPSDLTVEQFVVVAITAAAAVDRWQPARANLDYEYQGVDYGFRAWVQTDEGTGATYVIVSAPDTGRDVLDYVTSRFASITEQVDGDEN